MRALSFHNPVILNSFQDPFLGWRRSHRAASSGSVVLPSDTLAGAARWMLKRVQHDEFAMGGLAQ